MSACHLQSGLQADFSWGSLTHRKPRCNDVNQVQKHPVIVYDDIGKASDETSLSEAYELRTRELSWSHRMNFMLYNSPPLGPTEDFNRSAKQSRAIPLQLTKDDDLKSHMEIKFSPFSGSGGNMAMPFSPSAGRCARASSPHILSLAYRQTSIPFRQHCILSKVFFWAGEGTIFDTRRPSSFQLFWPFRNVVRWQIVWNALL